MALRKKPIGTDTIIAIAATVTSVCALIVTVYQTKLTREQQLNSVWPYLITVESIDERQHSSLMVSNYGIGPAIIDSVRLTYRGKAYTLPTQIISDISQQRHRGKYGMPWSHTGLVRGFVIPQGQTFTWITVNDSADNVIFRQEMPHIKSHIYYHSIYGERWHSVLHEGSDMVVKD